MATAEIQIQPNPPLPDAHGHVDIGMDRATFDPACLLRYVAPAKRRSFTELGLDARTPPIDMCITEAFELFTEKAVRPFRRELFQPEVFDNYMHSWARAPCVIRGIAPTVRPSHLPPSPRGCTYMVRL